VGCLALCKSCKCCKAALCEHKPVQHTTQKLYAMRLTKSYSRQANCMQHSASGEAKSSTASQQIWNRKVHCRLHNSPALFPNLNKTNPTIFPRPTIYLTSILILSSHLHLRPKSAFLHSCYPQKIHNFYFKHVSCSQ